MTGKPVLRYSLACRLITYAVKHCLAAAGKGVHRGEADKRAGEFTEL
jgi:hypothetical protein